MTHTLEIELTPAQEARCGELGALLCAYPLDALDAVLRDPAVQAALGALVTRALDKQLERYRAPRPRPLAWPD